MSVTRNYNNGVIRIPQEGDEDWAQYTTNTLLAYASSFAPATSGFTLLVEPDFGDLFGIRLLYVRSEDGPTASGGFLRMDQPGEIRWRNTANTDDDILSTDGTGNLLFNGVPLGTTSISVLDTATLDLGLTANTLSGTVNPDALRFSYPTLANQAATKAYVDAATETADAIVGQGFNTVTSGTTTVTISGGLGGLAAEGAVPYRKGTSTGSESNFTYNEVSNALFVDNIASAGSIQSASMTTTTFSGAGSINNAGAINSQSGNFSTSLTVSGLAVQTGPSGITAVVQDTAPQLGGNLDVNGKSIVSLAGQNIQLTSGLGGAIGLTTGVGGNINIATASTGFISLQSGASADIRLITTGATQIDLSSQTVSGTGNFRISGGVSAQSLSASNTISGTKVQAGNGNLEVLAGAIDLSNAGEWVTAAPNTQHIGRATQGSTYINTASGTQVQFRVAGTNYANVGTTVPGTSPAGGIFAVETVTGTQIRVARQLSAQSGYFSGPVQVGTNVSGTHAATQAYVQGQTYSTSIVAGTNISVTSGTNTITIASTSSVSPNAANICFNPSFNVWQRGTTINQSTTFTNNDDSYGPDNWNIVSDGNNAYSFSRVDSTISGATYMLQMQVETVNKKGGMVFFWENKDVTQLRGTPVTFYLEAANDGNTVGQLGMGIVEWVGTADSITSDIVSSWATSPPTLAANWNYLQSNAFTSSSLTTTSSGIKIEGKTISQSANNLGIFFYADDTTTTSGNKAYVTRVKFAPETTFNGYNEMGITAQQQNCQRLVQKSFAMDTMPRNGGSSFLGSARQNALAGTIPSLWIPLRPAMRTTPTVTLYNPTNGGTAAQWSDAGVLSSANARVVQATDLAVPIDNTNVVFPNTTAQIYIEFFADSSL